MHPKRTTYRKERGEGVKPETFAPPEPHCFDCLWWRERWQKAWCARPAGHHETQGACDDFERAGIDWIGMMTSNGEVHL